jgi:2,4-dienoyl-CoA reductase-like NADH-dependent reductase (Old Yellow Enzyme family)
MRPKLQPVSLSMCACATQVEPRLAGGNAERDTREQESLEHFRHATRRPFLAAGGFKRGSAIEAVKEGKADAVVFGEAHSRY